MAGETLDKLRDSVFQEDRVNRFTVHIWLGPRNRPVAQTPLRRGSSAGRDTPELTSRSTDGPQLHRWQGRRRRARTRCAGDRIHLVKNVEHAVIHHVAPMALCPHPCFITTPLLAAAPASSSVRRVSRLSRHSCFSCNLSESRKSADPSNSRSSKTTTAVDGRLSASCLTMSSQSRAAVTFSRNVLPVMSWRHSRKRCKNSSCSFVDQRAGSSGQTNHSSWGAIFIAVQAAASQHFLASTVVTLVFLQGGCLGSDGLPPLPEERMMAQGAVGVAVLRPPKGTDSVYPKSLHGVVEGSRPNREAAALFRRWHG